MIRSIETCARRLLLAALVGLPGFAARADDLEIQGNQISTAAWSADGRFVVHSEGCDTSHDEEESPPFQATEAVVIDLWTGQTRRFLTSFHGPKSGRAQFAKDGSAAEYAAWRKKHPVSRNCGRLSPDGKAIAVVFTGKKENQDSICDQTEWEKGQFSWGAWVDPGVRDPECLAADTAGIEHELRNPDMPAFLVKRGGKFTLSTTECEGTPYGDATIIPCWSPTGTRIAWTFNAPLPEEHNEGAFCIGPAQGPRIDVRANKELVPARLAEVVQLLEKRGFYPIRAGAAQDRREKSVVYAQKGHEAEAARVAVAVPGGAKVEPLTWKGDVDLVVALGASASGAP